MRRLVRLRTPISGALLGATLLPATALAAEPAARTSDGGSATLIVILLLGSLTAGLFFASPLRRRLDPPLSDAGHDRRRSQERAGLLRPGTAVVARVQRAADALLDAVGEQVAVRGRRLGPPRASPPLPPMPGGDVFFADDPPPAGQREPCPRSATGRGAD